MTKGGPRGIVFWRKLVEILEALVIPGLPFVRIKGQSAFRFDVPSLRLHFFGATLFMDEFFIVLAALVFLVFLSVFVTLMFGRVWCGWVCPQTVLVDYTGFLDKAVKKGTLYSCLSYGAVLLISAAVSASMIWYFVSPYEFFERLCRWRLGEVITGFWTVLTGMVFLNYSFLRHKWCATVCPYAKLQGVMFDRKSLVIAFDPRRKEECMECMACVKACPVGIDIRGGLDAACINCAACIDKCAGMMRPKNRRGLIGYFWGLPGETTRGILRTNAMLTGFLTAASFFFLIYMVMARTALDMTVLPNNNFYPRLVNGRAVNSYLLSIRNRGEAAEEFFITVEGLDKSRVIPDEVSVKKDEEKKIPVYVTAEEPAPESGTRSIELEIKAKLTGIKTGQKINFIIPSGG